MLDDKDVKKLVKAFKDVFPTAEMVQKSFLATDKNVTEGFKKVNNRLDAVIEKHDEEIKGLKGRVKVVEEALEI